MTIESVMPSALSAPTCDPDFLQRRLHDPHQQRSKRETNDHRDDQRDRHLYDGPSQILEMLEKRLGSFALGQFAKFENVSQRHRVRLISAARAK